MEAYKKNLHVRFANADTDKKLLDFIWVYGPLTLPRLGVPGSGIVLSPLGRCRQFQRSLRARINLLNAVNREGEREALLEYVNVESEVPRIIFPHREPFMVSQLRKLFPGIHGVDAIKGLDAHQVRRASDYLISTIRARAGLRCEHAGSRRFVKPVWLLDNLRDALSWMVWYDIFTRHPIMCCQECRKVFRGRTLQARKYCSHKCGHRATARDWQRKYNKRKSAERLA
jgi:hypothetical protein